MTPVPWRRGVWAGVALAAVALAAVLSRPALPPQPRLAAPLAPGAPATPAAPTAPTAPAAPAAVAATQPPTIGTAPAPPPLSAAAALLMDWHTGVVLYEKNGFVRRAPASTTKVLTALLALERGNLDDWVTISPRAARTSGSSMYLRAGEQYQLRDLLFGMLLQSGNDAAVAVAEHLAGSVEAFAAWMNQRARELGAQNSRFVNPHGLHHPGHYSTAHDLALITRHALQHPVFAAVVRQRDAQVGEGATQRDLRNTNRLLWLFEGADGVKTGTTSAAGACLISSATRPDPELGEAAGGRRLVAVVLDAHARWQDSIRLLEWGYEHFQSVAVAPVEPLGYLSVRGGREPWVPVVPAAPLAAVVRRGSADLPTVELTLPGPVTAPVRAGAVVGTATVRWQGRVQMQVPLEAAGHVPPATWATRLVRPLLPWLGRLRPLGLAVGP